MSISLMSMAWRVNLQTSHKMALLALCDWANDEGGSLHPSIKKVAERISCSDRTAQRIVHDLIEQDWLAVVGNANGGAPGQTRRYQINTAKLAHESVTGAKLSGVSNKTGDTGDARRVTNEAETGDTVVTQSTIEPSIEPPCLSSPGNPDDENSQQSTSTTQPATTKQTLPACPHLELLDIFAEQLPELPQPKPELWEGARAKALAARWKWCLTAKKRSGARYATTKAEAMDFFKRYFGYVGKSDFLTGRDGRWSGCDLAWLVKADNFAKVLQGNYENRQEATA